MSGSSFFEGPFVVEMMTQHALHDCAADAQSAAAAQPLHWLCSRTLNLHPHLALAASMTRKCSDKQAAAEGAAKEQLP